LFAGDEFVPREQSQVLRSLLEGLPPSPAAYRLVEVQGDHFSAILTKGSTVYAPAIVEALQLLDQDIDSVPPEQVSYCHTRA
jgi:hypothetical protein